jgi:arylsulfatase A-like enzyme
MKYLLFLIWLIFLSCQNNLEQDKPNILLIIADDLGYADMSFLPFAPGDVYTPHLGQIASQGTYFSNAYATSPICSPSRTGLITGRYQARWGNYWYGEGGLPAEELTIPQMLAGAGYRTYKIGKTHMNGGPVHHPLEHGFGEFLGFIDHTWDYLRLSESDVEAYGKENAKKAHLGPLIQNRQQVSYPDDYTTDIFTRKAVEIIETESDLPFYIHLSYNAVHHPTYVCHPEYLEAYGIEQFPFWDPQEEAYSEWHRKWGHLGEVDPDGRKRYLLQLQVMDEGIGRILAALQSSGKIDNTLIVFISDNGGTINTYANNQPLNGYKYMFGEGGIRVPLLICWPDHFPENNTQNELVSAMDIFPTLAEITGQPLRENLDGISLIPLLKGQTSKVHESLFFSNGRDSWVVRHGPWKLAHNIRWDHSSFKIIDGQCVRDSAYHYPGGTLLYNLENEIAEQSDLSGIYPEMVDSLQRLHSNWRKEMADPMRPQNP